MRHNDIIVAYPVGRKTMTAPSCLCTGGVFVQPYAVCGACHGFKPVNGGVQVGHNLVYACNYNNLLRTVNHRGYAVSVSVNVVKLAELGDCICACKICICIKRLAHNVSDFVLRYGVTVNVNVLVVFFQKILNTGLFQRHRAARQNQLVVLYQLCDKLLCYLGVVNKITLHVVAL